MYNKIKVNKILLIVVVFLFALIIGKLIYISASNTINGIDIKKFALSRTTETKTLYASRGKILDISGEILADTVNSYTVIAYLSESRTTNVEEPKHVVDIEYTVKKLAPVIGMDESRLRELLSWDAYQVELGPEGRGISEFEKERIEKLNLPGIDFIKETKRYYPYGSFASYIIGYAKKIDGEIIGEMGIESYYDEELKGENGFYEYQKDAYGYQIANTYVREKNAKNGNNITLTIDSNIQMFLENAINDFINEYSTDWVTITVADANTGAIVGSASNPTFDANILNITNYNNPLVSYAYEPGSTMKIFSFMSSIEEGLYKGEDKFTSGSIEVDNYTIKDWNKKGWGDITYDVGFTYSSNVAATLLAQGLGKEKLLKYYEDLGFGQKTGLELYGELNGKVGFLYDSELASASYGQGIMVTPIQMIQALTTLTNNGTVLKPYIVEKITDNENNTIYQTKKTELKKVYSTETVNKMIELMDKTVNTEDSSATGVVYHTDLVRLIGKTGTAQYTLENGKYSTASTKNIRSFAGIFPKDNPEYIIYVAVKDLEGTSSAMGKMTKTIVESIAKYKNLSERESNKDETKKITLPSYINKNKTDVTNELTNLGLRPIVIGDGDIVVSQFPNKNNTIIVGTKVFLKTNSINNILLDITGWTKSEIITYFNMLKLDYEVNGNGKVTSFNYVPNTEFTEKIIINLGEKDEEKKENDAEKENT